jgi:SAM-dependent methyltransferase
MDEALEAAPEIDALVYDQTVPDWPGELAFYGDHAGPVIARGGRILEIACGTGRVAIPLARAGANITGLDVSPAMLSIARRKSHGLDGVRWIEADMRQFDLGVNFDLIICPGHSFQFLLTADRQLECLRTLKRHLAPGGRLIIHLDHQDPAWLGDVAGERAGTFQPGPPVTLADGRRVRAFQAWTYDRSTQTATSDRYYEELDAAGQAIRRIDRGPVQLHCVFRTEMEHLLARAGLEIAALYGDFERRPLLVSSSDMIWVLTH